MMLSCDVVLLMVNSGVEVLVGIGYWGFGGVMM